jgi:hypothetical protein
VATLLHRVPVTTGLSALPGREPQAALDNIHHCYNPNWSCPLTPFGNRLKVPIRAGEKRFPDVDHE